MQNKSNKNLAEVSSQDPHLKQAVEILIERMKADEFMKFGLEALHWVNCYEKSRQTENSLHSHLAMLLDRVGIPWLSGGDEMKSRMIEGLEEMYTGFGHEYFYSTVLRVLSGYALCEEGVMAYPEYARKDINGINTLLEISYCFHEREQREAERRDVKTAA